MKKIEMLLSKKASQKTWSKKFKKQSNRFLKVKFRKSKINWRPDSTLLTCQSIKYRILCFRQKTRNHLIIIWLLFKTVEKTHVISILDLNKVKQAI